MNKALFLDRDGVLNIDAGYTHVWSEDLLIPGVCDLIKRFKASGFITVVVTNQSGIGRGIYDESAFFEFMRNMRATLRRHCADIDSFYFCRCKPSVPLCYFRKPNPGMLLEALKDHAIDPAHSVMVGDKMSDIQAAASAGIKKKYLFSPDGVPGAERSAGSITGGGFEVASCLHQVNWI